MSQGLVMNMWIRELHVIIDSGNGLSLVWHPAIDWINIDAQLDQ